MMSSLRVHVRAASLAPLLWTAACANGPHAPETTERPPNIIFIMADDLGYGDLGSYGQLQIETPRLDEMAAEGMRFTQFYAGSTVCAPSRSVLMTGLHTGHTRVRGNAGPDIQTLLPGDVTVAERLREAGYATALIGKWGLGDEGNTGLPNDQGFDTFFGYLNQVHAHNHFPEFLWRNRRREALRNRVEPAEGNYGGFRGGVARERVDYSGDLFFKEAKDWMSRHKDGPFFLYLALTVPHANNEAGRVEWAHGLEVPDLGPYADREWPEEQKGLAAMITRMDEGIGELMRFLKEEGLDEQTIVLFTSDNGPHAEGGNDPDFFDSNGPLRGIKRALYDGGIRVPFIVRGPGRVQAGVVSDYVGYFGDFFATACDWAGLPVPDTLDSISLVPVLSGHADEQRPHEYLYWEFYEQGSAQAVRKGPWKAVRFPMGTGTVELFNVAEEPSETTNVAAEHPDVVAEMAAIMDAAHVADPRWAAR